MRTRAAASAPALLWGALMLNMPINLSRAASACCLPTARCAFGSVFSITCSVGARSCSVHRQSSAALKSALLPGAPSITCTSVDHWARSHAQLLAAHSFKHLQ